MTAVPQNFPFGQVPALSQPPVTYDIVMAKNYPRVSFVPTETGGLYQELVEVNGDLWFITNATWDVNKLGFYQESGTLVNCNKSQNAYAWVQRGITGDAIRMYGAATNSNTVAVTWVPVFDAAPVGTVVSPLPLTQAGQAAFAVNVAFNGSNSTVLSAFQINVTNVASASLSPLAQYSVNGVPVWMVDTTGTLQIGKINPTQLSPPVYMTLNAGTGIAPIGPPPTATIGLAHDDYVDLPNNQTITGTKTIDTGVPMIFGGGWGNMIGGPDDAIHMCSGCEITNFPVKQPGTNTAIARSPTAMILAGKQEANNEALTLYINQGLTVGTTFEPTVAAFFDNIGNLTTNGDLDVGGQLSVTGGVQITGPLTVSGSVTLNGNLVLSSTTVQALQNYFEGVQTLGFDYTAEGGGHAGLKIHYDTINNAIVIDTSCLMYIGVGVGHSGSGIISTDGSVGILKNMNSTQVVDLSVSGSAKGSSVSIYRGGASALNNGIIIIGSQVVNLTSGTGGPNTTGAHGTATVIFPLSFNNSYDVSIAQTQGDWAICKVKDGSKTLSGFSVDAGTPWNTAIVGNNVTVDYVAVGS